jgi:NAD(P)-dependent dehydrogenase (short-subunit alcohol dehydrogenase family)
LIKSIVPDARIEFLPIDLASLKSVKQAADSFNSSSSRLDVLMNNAGIMACPAGLTKEGYEIQFGTNYLGTHYSPNCSCPSYRRRQKQKGTSGL